MGHNGKRVQAAGQYNGGDFPFVDHFKNGQGWSGSPNWVDPSQLDSNGWPTTMGTLTSITNKMYVPNRVQRPGNYIIDWQGQGTIAVSGSVTVTGSLTALNGSVTVALNADNVNTFSVGISAITSQITNIRVYHQDDASIVGTQVFSQKFLDLVSNFGVIRFLDLMAGGVTSGQNNVALWAHRKARTYAIWSAPEHRASLMTTATYALNGASNDYSATFGSGAPTHGLMVMFKVQTTATNTTVTFNLNGTGALPVLTKSGGALTSNSKPDSGSGKIATLIFNSTLNSWLQWGGNVNDGSLYILNGWPVDVCLDLCKAVGAHPWFVIPHVAFDPLPTDNIPAGLASYIKTNYQDVDCPWMIPRFEPPNELWNNIFIQTTFADNVQKVRNGNAAGTINITGFSYTGSGATGQSKIDLADASGFQVGAALFTTGTSGLTSWNGNTVYVLQKNVDGQANRILVNRAPTGGTWTSGGTVLGQANDRHNWYGRAVSDLGKAVAQVYGFGKAQVATQTKYQIICAVQTQTTPSASDERLKATNYVILGGDPGSDWATTVACAQYISPRMRGYPLELTTAWKYNQGDTSQVVSYLDDLANTNAAASSNAALSVVQANYSAWKTWAKGPWANGVVINRLCGYEGDWSPDYITTSQPPGGNISGATIDATGCTISFSSGFVDGTQTGGWVPGTVNTSGPFEAGTVVAGMQFTIASVAGMTQLNGLTATIVSVSGNAVKTNIDSSGFSAYTSGGTATIVNGRNMLNALRYAAKLHSKLAFYTQKNLTNFVNLTDATFTAEFPSFFLWSGTSLKTDLSLSAVAGDGQVWPIMDPDIYATNSPQFDMIKLINSHKRRMIW